MFEQNNTLSLILIKPLLGLIKPHITFAIVDFPLPDNPVIAIILSLVRLNSILDLKLPCITSNLIILLSIISISHNMLISSVS